MQYKKNYFWITNEKVEWLPAAKQASIQPIQ